MNTSIEIIPLKTQKEAEFCARTMASSEPWITLGRDYDKSLKSISTPSKEVYLAVDGGELKGFVSIVFEGVIVGYIQSICVSPKYRRKGIGKQLILFAETRIFKSFPNVFIFASSFNRDAQKLYRKLGYKKVGEIPDFIIPGESEILFRKIRNQKSTILASGR
jgi:ribosomal protein S18 acetylase RimI-like enzyme